MKPVSPVQPVQPVETGNINKPIKGSILEIGYISKRVTPIILRNRSNKKRVITTANLVNPINQVSSSKLVKAITNIKKSIMSTIRKQGKLKKNNYSSL